MCADGWTFKALGDICERQCPWNRIFQCLGKSLGYPRIYKKVSRRQARRELHVVLCCSSWRETPTAQCVLCFQRRGGAPARPQISTDRCRLPFLTRCRCARLGRLPARIACSWTAFATVR